MKTQIALSVLIGASALAQAGPIGHPDELSSFERRGFKLPSKGGPKPAGKPSGGHGPGSAQVAPPRFTKGGIMKKVGGQAAGMGASMAVPFALQGLMAPPSPATAGEPAPPAARSLSYDDDGTTASLLAARAGRVGFKPINRTPVRTPQVQGQASEAGRGKGGGALKKWGGKGLGLSASIAAPLAFSGMVSPPAPAGEEVPPSARSISSSFADDEGESKLVNRGFKGLTRGGVRKPDNHAPAAAQPHGGKGGALGRWGGKSLGIAGSIAAPMAMQGFLSQSQGVPAEASSPPPTARSLAYDADDEHLWSARSFDSYSADCDPISARSVGSFYDEEPLSARSVSDETYSTLLQGRDDFNAYDAYKSLLMARGHGQGHGGGGRGRGGRGGRGGHHGGRGGGGGRGGEHGRGGGGHGRPVGGPRGPMMGQASEGTAPEAPPSLGGSEAPPSLGGFPDNANVRRNLGDASEIIYWA